MTIKKAAKASIITAAAVAAIGIGAVSFAAWQNNYKTASAEVTLGQIALVGFKTENPKVTFDQKLVPYDQTEVVEGQATMVTVALPEYEASVNYTITVTTDSTLTFYANVSDADDVEAPTAVDAEGWVEVAKDGGAVFTYTVTEYKTETKYLNLILKSNNNGDMNKKASFIVTLASA